MAYLVVALHSYGLYSYGQAPHPRHGHTYGTGAHRQCVALHGIVFSKAYIVMAYIAMAYIVMAYIVMAYIVKAPCRYGPM